MLYKILRCLHAPIEWYAPNQTCLLWAERKIRGNFSADDLGRIVACDSAALGAADGGIPGFLPAARYEQAGQYVIIGLLPSSSSSCVICQIMELKDSTQSKTLHSSLGQSVA